MAALNACCYSRDGFTAAWRDEQAFRQIVWGCLAGLPLACWLGQTWGDRALLALVLVVALLVELLNSAIENVVDRISPELHPLSKKPRTWAQRRAPPPRSVSSWSGARI